MKQTQKNPWGLIKDSHNQGEQTGARTPWECDQPFRCYFVVRFAHSWGSAEDQLSAVNIKNWSEKQTCSQLSDGSSYELICAGTCFNRRAFLRLYLVASGCRNTVTECSSSHQLDSNLQTGGCKVFLTHFQWFQSLNLCSCRFLVLVFVGIR